MCVRACVPIYTVYCPRRLTVLFFVVVSCRQAIVRHARGRTAVHRPALQLDTAGTVARVLGILDDAVSGIIIAK
jgi:hypothetical protein